MNQNTKNEVSILLRDHLEIGLYEKEDFYFIAEELYKKYQVEKSIHSISKIINFYAFPHDIIYDLDTKSLSTSIQCIFDKKIVG